MDPWVQAKVLPDNLQAQTRRLERQLLKLNEGIQAHHPGDASRASEIKLLICI